MPFDPCIGQARARNQCDARRPRDGARRGGNECERVATEGRASGWRLKDAGSQESVSDGFKGARGVDGSARTSLHRLLSFETLTQRRRQRCSVVMVHSTLDAQRLLARF